MVAPEGWVEEGGALVRRFRFADFAGSLAFVNRVAAVADELDHHPDVDIRWDEVTLRLSSHDRGRVVTSRDHALAARIDAL